MANPVLAIRVDQNLKDRIAAVATERGVDASTVVREILAEKFQTAPDAVDDLMADLPVNRPRPPLRRLQ